MQLKLQCSVTVSKPVLLKYFHTQGNCWFNSSPLLPFVISLEFRVLYSIILLHWAVPKTTAQGLDFTIVLERAGVLTLYVC